jgi:hypothetical protein
VRDQIEKANKIAEEIQKANAGGQPADDQTPATSQENSQPREGGDPVSPPVAAAPQGAPAASAPAGKADDDWKHRYSVLQGKYNSEVPRLQTQLNELSSANADLRRRLTELETRPPTGKAPPAAAGDLAPITDDEIRAFGPDLYDFIQRAAAQIASKEVSRQTAGVKSKIQQVEQAASQAATSVAQSAREKLFVALTDAVPNWEAQNTDPGFIAWLDQRDPFSGEVRGKLLNEAYGRNDPERVIAFFTRFQQENAAVTPSDGSAAPTPKASEAQRSLSDFVAPGTPKTGPAGAPNEGGKRVWSRSEISAHYAKRGAYSRQGKKIPDFLEKEEREMNRAIAEGRVTG